MKASDLRDLPYHKLAERLAEAKEELFNLRFQLATNQLEKPSRITSAKRDLARVKTLLVEKQTKRA